MKRALPLALIAGLVVFSGCAMQATHTPVPREPRPDEATAVERRAGELVRRGAPRDKAIAQASGDVFFQTESESRDAEYARSEQRKINDNLAQMYRNRPDGR